MNYETWLIVKAFITTAAMRILGALVVWFVGAYAIKWLMKIINRILKRSDAYITLVKFINSFVKIALKILLAVTVVIILGVPNTSFIAILGAAGLAIGLALQGSLSNFAGGVLILVFRPFNIGDYIEAGGFGGTVQAIQILYTVLLTPDNKTIVIPNGNLSNNSVTNYSSEEMRRVDLKFGVSYDSDISKVKEVISKICDSHDLVLKEPAPFIRVVSHGDSSIDFVVRPWVEKEDYWTVYFDMQEQVKEAFDKNGIEIPYPHMDVTMLGQ